MVVTEELVEEVNGLVGHETLVLRGDKAVPRLLLEAAKDVVVLCIKLNLVLVQIIEEIVRAENLGNLDQLVGVAASMEERLLPKDH